MTAEQYNACTRWLNQTPFRAALFRALFRILPVLSAVCYLLTLLFLFLTQHEKWLRFLLIPALVFMLVTILRKLLNIQRLMTEWTILLFFLQSPERERAFQPSHRQRWGYCLCLLVSVSASRHFFLVHHPSDCCLSGSRRGSYFMGCCSRAFFPADFLPSVSDLNLLSFFFLDRMPIR